MKNAGLDVTAICMPMVKDSPFTGKYNVGVNEVPAVNLYWVGNREVGDFVNRCIKENLYVGERVGISNTE